MICRIGIDEKALLEHKSPTRIDLNVHRSMARAIEQVGFLQSFGKTDTSSLRDAISELFPEARDIWSNLLTSLDFLNRFRSGEDERPLHQMIAQGLLSGDVNDLLDLVVVSQEETQALSIPALDGFVTRPGEPELSLADSLANTATIENALEKRLVGHFSEGSARGEIWEELFAKPTALSSEVTLLDRYFLTSYFHTSNATRTETKRDHAEWVIGTLIKHMQPRSKLRILSESPYLENTKYRERQKIYSDALDHSLGSLLVDKNSPRLSVCLARWKEGEEGTKKAHNRHIRFSCGVGLLSHEGFDRLGTPEVEGVDGFTWSTVTDTTGISEMVEREQMVLNSRQAFTWSPNRASSRQ